MPAEPGMTGGGFTIRGLSLRSVVVPMARPLVTRVVTIEKAAFVLIDLETEEGSPGEAICSAIPRPATIVSCRPFAGSRTP